MRILLLIPALFITGVQGHNIVQQDNPHEDKEPVIFKILKEAAEIVNTLRRNLEDSEIVKEFKIKEKVHAATDSVTEIQSEIEDYLDKVWKKINLEQKFPVFTENVLPVLEDFANNLEEHANNSAMKLWSTGTESFHGMKNLLTAFMNKVESVAEESRGALRSEIHVLKEKIQPYMDDVRAEYDRYIKNMK